MSETNTAIVAAPGPSLPAVAARCDGFSVVAVGDALRLLPQALACYAGDLAWWTVNCTQGASWSRFTGEKIVPMQPEQADDEELLRLCEHYGATRMPTVDTPGFLAPPGRIACGDCSLFGAISYALGLGYTRLILVGADMRVVDGRRHFFGDHPAPLSNRVDYSRFVPQFERAAALLPAHVSIVNATPGSALRCFPIVDLNSTPAAFSLFATGVWAAAGAGAFTSAHYPDWRHCGGGQPNNEHRRAGGLVPFLRGRGRHLTR